MPRRDKPELIDALAGAAREGAWLVVTALDYLATFVGLAIAALIVAVVAPVLCVVDRVRLRRQRGR